MSDAIITVENLGKKYRIMHQAEKAGYTTFREVLVNKARGIFNNDSNNSRSHGSKEDFWALKDVSFEVKRGEVVGIIGRNGAGKSTLLKILSRITEPTTGEVRLRGRVASLLEVGTGFHPELTGRENIFLNGAVLGMSRVEIKRKFDEIVAFSEVEKFLDTPVKRYSSGMYVRLAFAVAAYLEPEILIVDEVLAVGDAEFQKKCLGKMQKVAGDGRALLFVSHQMAAVQSLCSRSILFRSGQRCMDGDTQAVVNAYLNQVSENASTPVAQRNDREGDGAMRLTDVRILVDAKGGTQIPQSGNDVMFILQYKRHRSVVAPIFQVSIYDSLGVLLFHVNTRSAKHLMKRIIDQGSIICSIPNLPLPPGKYRVNTAIYEHSSLHDRVEGALEFNVEAGDFFGSGSLGGCECGKVLLKHSWSIDSNCPNAVA